jgi:hypothetical protein
MMYFLIDIMDDERGHVGCKVLLVTIVDKYSSSDKIFAEPIDSFDSLAIISRFLLSEESAGWPAPNHQKNPFLTVAKDAGEARLLLLPPFYMLLVFRLVSSAFEVNRVAVERLRYKKKRGAAIISKTAVGFQFLLGNSHVICNQLVSIVPGSSVVPPKEPREAIYYPRQLHAKHSPPWPTFQTLFAFCCRLVPPLLRWFRLGIPTVISLVPGRLGK